MTTIRLTTTGAQLEASLDTRIVSGVAVPFGVTGYVGAEGRKVRFLPGSLALTGTVPLLRDHDASRPIGRVLTAVDDDGVLRASASVSRTADGDEALLLADDDVLTGLSVGVDPLDYTLDPDGTMVVSRGRWKELSLVTLPAYDAARVESVAAAEVDDQVLIDAVAALNTTAAALQESIAAAPPEAPASDTSGDTMPNDAPVAAQAPAPAVVAAAPRRSGTRSAPRLPTLGEYLYARLNRRTMPSLWDRTAATIQAAAPHTFVGDVPGIVPELIVGDVVSTRASDRPIMESFGPLAGPAAGASFTRPVIVDPIADASTATEKSDVTDQLLIDPLTVDWSFVKRAANLSAEVMAFTSPEILQVAAQDLIRAYNRGTEKVACAALEGSSTTPVGVLTSELEAALYAQAAVMYGAVGVLPTHLCVAPDIWALIGGTTAVDGRTLFPVLGPQNAGGTSEGVTAFSMNVLGLNVVVSYGLTPAGASLVAGSFVESYEGHRVSMSADEPTIMGHALSTGGAAALVILDDAAVVPLTITAPVAP